MLGCLSGALSDLFFLDCLSLATLGRGMQVPATHAPLPGAKSPRRRGNKKALDRLMRL